MPEGKTLEELKLEHEMDVLLKQEELIKIKAKNLMSDEFEIDIDKEDLVKGIILREILGPPKALENE